MLVPNILWYEKSILGFKVWADYEQRAVFSTFCGKKNQNIVVTALQLHRKKVKNISFEGIFFFIAVDCEVASSELKAGSDDLTVENNPCDTLPAQMSSETEIATCEPGAGKSESRTDLVVGEANQDDNSHVTDEAVDEITEHVARCNIDEKVRFFYERWFVDSDSQFLPIYMRIEVDRIL